MNGLVKKLADAFYAKKIRNLKKVSDDFVDEVVKEYTPEPLRLAVLAYVLSKIVTKTRFFLPERKEKLDRIVELLKKLEEKNNFGAIMSEIEKTIMDLEQEDPRFIFDLFTKGKVKIAAILYAKGLSLGKASNLTGIPKQEILSYAGKTMMFDRLKDEIPVSKRLKTALELIGE